MLVSLMRRKSSSDSFRGRELVTWWLYFQGQTGYWSCSPASRYIEAESEQLQSSRVNGVNSWNDQLDASCQWSRPFVTASHSAEEPSDQGLPTGSEQQELKPGLWISPEAQPKWESHRVYHLFRIFLFSKNKITCCTMRSLYWRQMSQFHRKNTSSFHTIVKCCRRI